MGEKGEQETGTGVSLIFLLQYLHLTHIVKDYQIASKAKESTPTQARPVQKATTKAVMKASTAPGTKVAALVKSAGAQYRRSKLVPMNRIRIVQEAIQQRDLDKRDLLETNE